MDRERSSRKAQLNKGKACFNCRRRKVKCDAKKPICTPCVQFVGGGLHDCEYTESGPAQSQVLEEQISIIESRIQELEQPKEMRTLVGLHNPYQSGHRRTSSEPQFGAFAPSPSTSTSHLSSNPGHKPHSIDFFQALISNFMRYGSQIGFFLDPQLFEAVSRGAAPSQVASPALLDTVYLWGAHLSRSDKLSVHETSFLSDALRSTAASLANARCTKAILQTIQAEILLAQYFFRNARILEGKYHGSAAVSITLSSGLHKIRSADVRDSVRTTAGLSPTANEGERINAFWAALTLNNCWFTADGSPRDVSYSVVDTPWPLGIEAYSEVHAEAHISHRSPNTFSSEFSTLDGVIEALKQMLPPVQPNGTESLLLVIHTLAHVATIQLHNPFCLNSGGSRARAGSAAMAVVGLLRQANLRNLGYIDAIVGTLWTAACQVFITELSRARYSPGGAKNVQQLCEAVETLLAAMSLFSRDCRMIELQLATAQQNYATVRNR
ncbi:hypothetical protein B0H13DRAFT_2269065 [Mycena leptocephala]|nr:hypothetical protein B0H13DRAFT_2269065 [Mycena leptocephala]